MRNVSPLPRRRSPPSPYAHPGLEAAGLHAAGGRRKSSLAEGDRQRPTRTPCGHRRRNGELRSNVTGRPLIPNHRRVDAALWRARGAMPARRASTVYTPVRLVVGAASAAIDALPGIFVMKAPKLPNVPGELFLSHGHLGILGRLGRLHIAGNFYPLSECMGEPQWRAAKFPKNFDPAQLARSAKTR